MIQRHTPFLVTFIFANLSNWNSVCKYTYNYILCLYSNEKEETKSRYRLERARASNPWTRSNPWFTAFTRISLSFPATRRIQRVARFGNLFVTIPASNFAFLLDLTFANRECEMLAKPLNRCTYITFSNSLYSSTSSRVLLGYFQATQNLSKYYVSVES